MTQDTARGRRRGAMAWRPIQGVPQPDPIVDRSGEEDDLAADPGEGA